MNHTVVISVAPVLSVLDDQANLLSLIAIPLTFALWFPCWLHSLIFQLGYSVTCRWRDLREYLRGWRDDLRLMWLAWNGQPWALGCG